MNQATTQPGSYKVIDGKVILDPYPRLSAQQQADLNREIAQRDSDKDYYWRWWKERIPILLKDPEIVAWLDLPDKKRPRKEQFRQFQIFDLKLHLEFGRRAELNRAAEKMLAEKPAAAHYREAA